MSETVLFARGLRMAYRSLSLRHFRDFFAAPVARVALTDCGLELAAHERVAVVGKNGAGKTTLLKILAGLILPPAGEVKIGGEDMLRNPHGAKRQLGYMSSQERSFYWRLTARRNLEFFGALYGMPGAEMKRRIGELAEAVHLTKELDAPFRSLSSGTQQRVGLMRALLHRPRVLLLDEPTRSLDAAAAADFWALLERLRRDENAAVLYATHAGRELRAADRVHVIREGRMVWSGAPRELAALAPAGTGEGDPLDAALLAVLGEEKPEARPHD